MSRSSTSRSIILHVKLPDGQEQEVFLQHGLTIGRNESNMICVDHPDVERIHARVLGSGIAGTFRVECEAQRCGLLAEGSAEPCVQLAIADGTQFRIGPALFTCTLQSDRTNADVQHNWETQLSSLLCIVRRSGQRRPKMSFLRGSDPLFRRQLQRGRKVFRRF